MTFAILPFAISCFSVNLFNPHHMVSQSISYLYGLINMDMNWWWKGYIYNKYEVDNDDCNNNNETSDDSDANLKKKWRYWWC